MTVLLGSTGVGTDGTDFENKGRLIGSKYVAGATGTVDRIAVRISSTNTFNGQLLAAVYSDSAGSPGTMIGNAVSFMIASGVTQWVTSSAGASAAVTSGTTYWIVFLTPNTGGGQWEFKLFDSTTVAGTKDSSAATNETPPASFGTVGSSLTELINAYAQDAGFVLANNFEGGAGLDETAITTGNSGGASGDAFTAVTSGGVFETSVTLKGSACARIDSDGAAHTLAWTVTSSPRLFGRIYFRKTANPPAAFRLVRFRGGGVLGAGINVSTGGSLQWLAGTAGDSTGGTSTTALVNDVMYRIEWDITFGTGTAATMTANVYDGDNTNIRNTFAFSGTFTNTITTADTVQFGTITVVAAGFSIYLDSIQVNDRAMPGPDSFPPPAMRTFNPVPFMR